MKKIIAIMMALVMMMAIAVPAFAAVPPLTQDETSGDAIVKTSTASIVGDGTYSVSYPATMILTWGATSSPFAYTVTSQLKTGKCVKVTVADKDDAYTMTNATNATLAYTLTGTTEGKTTAPVVNDASFSYNVDVAEAAWLAASIDEYQDTLTFTSAVVDIA